MTSPVENPIEKIVKTRRVFYVPGYDPFHPRRYRELFRKESRKQANISGYSVDLKPKNGGNIYGWDTIANIDDHDVFSSVEVLVWSDIVRKSMSTDIPQTYLQLLKTAWIYLSSGALLRLMRLRKGPIIAALYPVFALLIQLVFAIFAGWAIGSLMSVLLPWFSGAAFWICQWVIPLFVLRWFKQKDGKFFAYYLMNDFAHSAKHKGAFSPQMLDRMSQFKAIVKDAMKRDVDEVLVVGHSSGAHIALSFLSDILREDEGCVVHGKLAFLSLGHVIPMVSFLPNANSLRSDLRFLSEQNVMPWVDVTAPGDGCSFALCDPVAVTGVATENSKWPLVFSAAFTQSLSPERWNELRWRFFRLHFQYLCAFDRPKDYDYFKITCGPLTLAKRYEGRLASKSVMRRPTSGYRSTS